MSARRVLVVSPYRTEYGPPQTLEHVCRALYGAGYEPVCVVAVGAHITPTLRELGPVVRELDGLGTFPRTLNVLRLVAFFRSHLAVSQRMQEVAREENVEAIYSISEAIFAGSLAAKRLDLPSLVHVIGMSIRSPRWVGSLYVRFLDRLTDQFIACSSAVAEMLDGYGVADEKVTVVHNGIDVGFVGSAAGGHASVGHRGPKVGVVAAYDPRKGHELFVETATLVAAVSPDARFYLIGGSLDEHPDSVAFERQVVESIRRNGLEDRFERTGFVPAPEVYRWIRELDVAVVPSRTEAFAHALLEEMACGRAVVATAIEGNLDAFVHDHSGLYVEPRAEAVAEAVCSLLADPGRAAELGRNAHERVRLLYDVSVTIPALGAAVRHLLAGARAVEAGAPEPAAA